MAAGTLDASTKIYAVRVDAVHADAYRVLGGLGSETKPRESEYLFESWDIVRELEYYENMDNRIIFAVCWIGRSGLDCNCLPGG